MLLTKRYLREHQESMQISIPDDLAKELLNIYGINATDEEEDRHDYTEQDICEQIRKILHSKIRSIDRGSTDNSV